jgi:hypothetical protein
MKKERIKLSERTPENDIKFKGILSYRHLRIIAWVCLVLAQISVVISFNIRINPSSALVLTGWEKFFSAFSSLPVPLFLLANFSVILQKKDNYRYLFLFYGGMALLMYFFGNFVVFHFGHRLLNSITHTLTWGDTAKVFGIMLPALGKTGYTFNIFIDIFLCVLMLYFMNYNPKKVFVGKKLIIFRLFVILPIIYEVAGIVIKYYASIGALFGFPSYVFFLLPSKPPFIFLAFVLLLFLLKINEYKHLKKTGKDKKTYEQHLKTNAHSLQVSIAISIIIFICIILDIVVFFALFAHIYSGIPDVSTIEGAVTYSVKTNALIDTGFLGSVPALFIIPLIMFFSYTKTHKNAKIDTIIPVAGIALILIVYIEGLFEAVTINMTFFLDRLKEAIQNAINGNSGTGEEPQPEEGQAIIRFVHKVSESIRQLL